MILPYFRWRNFTVNSGMSPTFEGRLPVCIYRVSESLRGTRSAFLSIWQRRCAITSPNSNPFNCLHSIIRIGGTINSEIHSFPWKIVEFCRLLIFSLYIQQGSGSQNITYIQNISHSKHILHISYTKNLSHTPNISPIHLTFISHSCETQS